MTIASAYSQPALIDRSNPSIDAPQLKRKMHVRRFYHSTDRPTASPTIPAQVPRLGSGPKRGEKAHQPASERQRPISQPANPPRQ